MQRFCSCGILDSLPLSNPLLGPRSARFAAARPSKALFRIDLTRCLIPNATDMQTMHRLRERGVPTTLTTLLADARLGNWTNLLANSTLRLGAMLLNVELGHSRSSGLFSTANEVPMPVRPLLGQFDTLNVTRSRAISSSGRRSFKQTVAANKLYLR